MEELYSRNEFYLTDEQQEKIKKTRILLGGAGIGSIIAEQALRIGFERITIIDGDKVELSNLNRQNYLRSDVGRYKAECLAIRLLEINPNAFIEYHCNYIDDDNLDILVKNCDIAVNALDFNSEIPFKFDERCRELGCHVIHPYNLGWGGLVVIVSPTGQPISVLSPDSDSMPRGFELQVADYIYHYSKFWNKPANYWVGSLIQDFKEVRLKSDYFPQIMVGGGLAAGLAVNAMVRIALNQPVKLCPKFYLASMLGDVN